MHGRKNTASGSVDITVVPKHSWDEKMDIIQQNGLRIAMEYSKQGLPFVVKPLAPKEVQGEDTIPLSGVVIKLDWQIAKKLQMVDSARDMITYAYILNALDPAFPTVLRSIIEGKGLYKHSIGEFFQLYGKFEGQHQLTSQKDTRDKMKALVEGDKKYLKCYRERGKTFLYPPPYAVRNILAHSGNKSNTLDPEGKELQLSIELLRSWVAS